MGKVVLSATLKRLKLSGQGAAHLCGSLRNGQPMTDTVLQFPLGEIEVSAPQEVG